MSYDERGTFGDMFGSISALFSGLALAGIIFTILLQRQELKLQREELKETRKEFEIQNKTLKLQRFENTFFQMISLHNQIVSSIEYETLELSHISVMQINKKIIKGKEVFKILFEAMDENIGKCNNLNEFCRGFIEFWINVETYLDLYFRNLYRLLRLVDSSRDVVGDQYTDPKIVHNFSYKYISIVRDLLSDNELLWLFHYCIGKGDKQLKFLIEEYSLFKNLQSGKIRNQYLMHQFKNSAYYPSKN